jgi:hypothetical protein
MAVFSLAALKAEIETDPLALGYKDGAAWKGDQEIADIINAKNYTVDRQTIAMADVRAVVPFAEFNALQAGEKAWLQWLTQGDGQVVVNADFKTKTAEYNVGDGIWQPGDEVSADAIKALIETPGSRAEVLWKEGTHITASHVGGASNA